MPPVGPEQETGPLCVPERRGDVEGPFIKDGSSPFLFYKSFFSGFVAIFLQFFR